MYLLSSQGSWHGTERATVQVAQSRLEIYCGAGDEMAFDAAASAGLVSEGRILESRGSLMLFPIPLLSSHVLHSGRRPEGPSEADQSLQEEDPPGEEAATGSCQIHGLW